MNNEDEDNYPHLPEYRLVLAGKTGSGKSTLGNALLRHEGNVFPVYTGMEGQTMEVQENVFQFGNNTMHVVDTPDMYNMGQAQSKTSPIFDKWQELTSPSIPTAILLVMRLDVRFTPNDYQLYKQYVQRLPRLFRDNVIIAFTRVEHLRGSVEEEVTLTTVRDILSKAKNRFVPAHHPMSDAQRGEFLNKVIRFIQQFDTTPPDTTAPTFFALDIYDRILRALIFVRIAEVASAVRERICSVLRSSKTAGGAGFAALMVLSMGGWFYNVRGGSFHEIVPTPPWSALSLVMGGAQKTAETAATKVIPNQPPPVSKTLTWIFSITGITPDSVAQLLYQPY